MTFRYLAAAHRECAGQFVFRALLLLRIKSADSLPERIENLSLDRSSEDGRRPGTWPRLRSEPIDAAKFKEKSRIQSWPKSWPILLEKLAPYNFATEHSGNLNCSIECLRVRNFERPKCVSVDDCSSKFVFQRIFPRSVFRTAM